MSRWEVFHPNDGNAVHTFRWRWLAWAVARLYGGAWDYARHGEGW